MLSLLGMGLIVSQSSKLKTYLTRGMFTTINVDPDLTMDNGQIRYSLGEGDDFIARGVHSPGKLLPKPITFNPKASGTVFENIKALGAGNIAKTAAGSAIGLGSAAWLVHQGYQEDGLSGAASGVMQEAAISSAIGRWAYTTGPTIYGGKAVYGTGVRLAGAALRPDKFLMRGVGASLGSTIGGALFGTPGQFLGAYIGAAPMRFVAANPAGAVAVTALAATAAISYGAYTVVKGVAQEGYARRQSLRGVNTSGDMSAFMTQTGYTMRARAVQAISKSHLNARSALGQEASLIHRPYINQLSRYR